MSGITRVHVEVLRGDLEAWAYPISVAQRMSWAVGRQTTREKDRVYLLMGLFGVNMPLLYGEGARAIIRLQEEIKRTTDDHSLFAWRNDSGRRGLLATSIDHFKDCDDIISVDYATYDAQFSQFREAPKDPMPNFSQTNYCTYMELRFAFPLNDRILQSISRLYLDESVPQISG